MTNHFFRLESLYNYFYKECGDMERAADYEKIIIEIPKVKELWENYKEACDLAKVIFEYKFEKLMEKYNDQDQ